MKTLILLIAASALLFAQASKEAVFNKLKTKYQNINSIEIEFHAEADPRISGILKAELGNKYFLDFEDKIITSNGENIYNFRKPENLLIVSKYGEANQAFAFEKFFFRFLEEYKPISLAKISASSKGNYLKLLLEHEKFGKEGQVELRLDPKNYSVTGVGFSIGEVFNLLIIDKISVNKKFKDEIFTFEPFEDTEVMNFD